MYTRLDRPHRALAVVLGFLTLVSVGFLFLRDAAPHIFPARSHDFLAAFSLTTTAIAYLVYQASHRPPLREMAKAILLAVAFLFWAANQLWPESAQATLLNDIAIALFVVDVFLVMVGWPAPAADESFAEAEGEAGQLRKEELPE
jgi:hypothetical protein